MPIDSSDSEAEQEVDRSNVLAEQEVIYVEDKEASKTKTGRTADTSDTDDQAVAPMPDIEPMV